jgi:tetratricopeptide (TPR) repeat protein
MPAPTPPPAFRILGIISRPLDLQELPHLADQRSIYNGLNTVQVPVYLKLLQPPTVNQLRKIIYDNYDVIHFDGHGDYGLGCSCCNWVNNPGSENCAKCGAELKEKDPKGYLAFEKENGTLDSLEAVDLAELISFAPKPPKLIVLSACESAKGNTSGVMEKLLQKGSFAVLGMKEPVPDNVTKVIFGPFYAALGGGLSIKEAFESVQPILKNIDGKDYRGIPVLAGHGIDISLTQKGIPPGKIRIDKTELYGVPEVEFIGEYVRYAPPKGRKGILSQIIQALVQDKKLVALTGQGGIGKTVLAAETAQRIAWRYPGGVFWKSAAEQEFGFNELLDAFDQVYGEEFRKLSVDDKENTIQSRLGNLGTPCLLVLDNAEKIQDQSLWTFLEGIPQPSAALVTIREAGNPHWTEIHLAPMEPGEAETLFVHEAQKKKSDWKTPQSQIEKQNIQEIYGILEGQPQGIVLAASLVKSLSLYGILESLKTHPPTELSNRYDFSYNTLTESQKVLLQRMSAFGASVTEDAAKAVCMDRRGHSKHKDLKITLEDLGELVRMSFVDRFEVPVSIESGKEINCGRYRLHPLIRQYAQLKAGEGIVDTYRSKAAEYFLTYASRFVIKNYDLIDLERENILTGMSHMVEEQNSATGKKKMRAASRVIDFMDVLYHYLEFRGFWNENKLRTQQAIDSARVIKDKTKECLWTHDQGVTEEELGNFEEARNLYQKSLEIGQKIENNRTVPYTLYKLGTLAELTGSLNEARNFYQQSIDIARKLDEKRCLANSLRQLGEMAQGKEAYTLCKQSLDIANEIHDPECIMKGFSAFGMIALRTKHYNNAYALFQQRLDYAQKIGLKEGISSSLRLLGIWAQTVHKYERARDYYQQSLKMDIELGYKWSISENLRKLGALAYLSGNDSEARNLLLQALDIKRQLNDRDGIGNALGQLSQIEEKTGNIPSALARIDEAEKIFREIKNPKQVEQAQEQRKMIEEKWGKR